MTKTRDSFIKLVRFIGLMVVVAAGLASILATGGGGGGGDGAGASSGGTGSVALYVADNPADSYQHIFIWITRVELIPSEGSGGAPVVIYKSPNSEGCKIDLLNHRDGEDFFLTLKPKVPAGWYDKVRLYVSNIESVGGTCDLEFIKLPSGKIDLNPREPFQVKRGEAVAIRLDIDANKSINLHEAGNSEKCIFRPVVFVDVEPLKLRSGCPEILTGKITQIIGTSFLLSLPDERGILEVRLADTTAIFDQDGLPATAGALKVGDSVWVRGIMDPSCRLNASVVVVGDVMTLGGVIQTTVDPLNQFAFLPSAGEEIIGELDVLLALQTLVLVGCDTPVDWDEIQPNRRAKVVGKYDTVEDVFRGFVVFLKELEISGKIVSVSEKTEGLDLVIQPSGTTEVPKTVFLPSNAPVYLEGDGEFPRSLLCVGREVRMTIDPTIVSPLTAKLVRVISETLEGEVQADDFYNRILVVKPNGSSRSDHVFVQPYATILDLTDGKYQPLDITDIWPGDVVKCFGVSECTDNLSFNDFYAFVVLVTSRE